MNLVTLPCTLNCLILQCSRVGRFCKGGIREYRGRAGHLIHVRICCPFGATEFKFFLLLLFLFRYKGYHDDYYPYKRSSEYWNILAARFAFVFVFQFIVYSITTFIAWIVPDTPEELEFKKKREKELEKSFLQDHNNENI